MQEGWIVALLGRMAISVTQKRTPFIWQKRVKEVTVDGEREDYLGLKGVPLLEGEEYKGSSRVKGLKWGTDNRVL